MYDLTIFKDYDVRGIYPTQINRDVVTAIAHAIVKKFSPKSVAICRDMRVSGDELRDAFVEAFLQLGVNVADAGLCGTEISYFIAGTYDYDLVIMISASHNPPEYNGIKLTKKGALSVTSDSGLFDVRDLITEGPLPPASQRGTLTMIDVIPEWRKKILSLVNLEGLKPLSVVVDAGNGMAGKLVPSIFEGLPFKVTGMYMELDGRFPHHIPNPLVEKNTEELRKKVVELDADVGLAFDGDADRMFLIDDKGRFVSGTITTAILSKYILKHHPGEMILYNVICGRVVPKVISDYGGRSRRVRVGHSYIKQYMREENAIFAGEHSGHYFHRDFFFAESGVLTALMVLSLLSQEQKKLSEYVDEFSIYPASGEINFVVPDARQMIQNIKDRFVKTAQSIDEIDGVSVWYPSYWFNVRASKTEPLLRLNMEADTQEILDEQLNNVIAIIEEFGGKRKS
ncbi:MAG: phosphomannomutase/phosphoglucomutase [Patescibacteria group bacterium]|nr:phosphomannomutase/phosphoglucomutase [Patescibacteria group bacterium]